ncbi:hypothetical protein [Burkholderia vietnamiensis]|uniref:hypothetical protein n=1 Tax=Burkholderia vietnamiensis TaxID=60552 RepID=UPI001B9CA52D|nr:hypothetical protein [Burkholderia vietnamiensis]MBR8279070.1 hypothetical protein [Burkholderia vietnamiensis]
MARRNQAGHVHSTNASFGRTYTSQAVARKFAYRLTDQITTAAIGPQLTAAQMTMYRIRFRTVSQSSRSILESIAQLNGIQTTMLIAKMSNRSPYHRG